MTIPELQALAIGYLTGLDLSRWVSPNLLIKQYDVDNAIFTSSMNMAIEELKASTRTRYDLSTELAKVDLTTRDVLVVKILSILTCRNTMGNFQNVGDWLMAQFDWADSTLKALRNGQFNLAQPGVTPITVTDPITNQLVTYTPASVIEQVNSSFSTLG